MILPYKFLYSRKFYSWFFALFFTGSCIFGFLYYAKVSKNKSASIALYTALTGENNQRKQMLEQIAKSEILPYADFANMLLASSSLQSQESDEMGSRSLYKKVALNSNILAIRDLASFYQSHLDGDFFKDIKVYNSSYEILKGAHKIEDGKLQDAKNILENVHSSLDTTDSAQRLTQRLLLLLQEDSEVDALLQPEHDSTS